ncbi:MAG: DUF6580 family putative transport protein [Candidatus Magasanikbacteria bacterium]
MKKQSLLAILFLLALGITTRFIPHPANFTAIGAIAMFSGLYLPRRWAIAGPILVMLISDIFIGFYAWQIMLSVYAGFTVMGLIGLKVRANKKITTVIGGTLLGSVIFYLVTNFMIWAFGTMYAHNFTGLIQSYTMAIPFFKNSLTGDIAYITILAGSYEMAMKIVNQYSKQVSLPKSIATK